MIQSSFFENSEGQPLWLSNVYFSSTDELTVNKSKDIVPLLPKPGNWDSFMQAIDMFSDDFMSDGRVSDATTES